MNGSSVCSNYGSGIRVAGSLSFIGNPSNISHNAPYGVDIDVGVYSQAKQTQVILSGNNATDLITASFIVLPNPMSLPATIQIRSGAPNPVIACMSGHYFDRDHPLDQNKRLHTRITCHNCGVGRAQQNTFAFSCDLCAPGLFAAGNGSNACAHCPQGYFWHGRFQLLIMPGRLVWKHQWVHTVHPV